MRWDNSKKNQYHTKKDYTYTGGFNVLKLWFKSINESLLSAGIFLENEKTHSELDCLIYTGLPGMGTCPGDVLLLVLCASTSNSVPPRDRFTAIIYNVNKRVLIVYVDSIIVWGGGCLLIYNLWNMFINNTTRYYRN